jgi:hypothetical protein
VLIDCDDCSVRGAACRDCVVTVILNNPAHPVELDEAEQYAVGSLAAAGLVPPLRLLSDSSRVDLGNARHVS